jgi:hypothetical protein
MARRGWGAGDWARCDVGSTGCEVTATSEYWWCSSPSGCHVSSTASARGVLLVGAAELVRIEDALVANARSWTARRLEEDGIFIIRVVQRLDLSRVARLWSLHCFGRIRSGHRLGLQLLHSEVVPVLAVLARHGIAQLLQTLGSNAKLLGNDLLRGIIREQDEGLESHVGVFLLVDAPQDMTEEGLKMNGDSALGSLFDAGQVDAAAGVVVGRVHHQSCRLILVFRFIDRPGALAQERLGRLGRLGRVFHAMCGAHRGPVRHVERIKGALEILVVLILVRLAVFHGQQRLGQHMLLYLAPRDVRLLDAFQFHAVSDFARHRRDLVEPFHGLAGVGVDALRAGLEAVQLGEGWRDS